MKKTLSLLVVIIIAVLTLVGCVGGNYIDDIAKKADTYNIVMSYDSVNHKVSAVQTMTVSNRCDNSQTSIKLHLFANAYSQDAKYNVVPNKYFADAYPNGTSYGDISIDYVKVDNQAVAYTIEGRDNDILSIPLAAELFPDEKVAIEMSYIICLPNMAHRLGYTDNTVNLGNFFPILCYTVDNQYSTTPYYAIGDPFVTDMANFQVTITLPSDYIIAGTGQLQSTTQSELGVTYTYSARSVRDFAMVLSTKFKVKTYSVDDTTLNYYYYNDSQAEATLATIIAVFNYMNKTVGKYPYATLSIAETEFCYGGMEYPQMVMVSSGSTEYNTAVAHEIIHQWFYGLVGNNQIANAWMDEALTEFVTMQFLDDNLKVPLSTSIKQRHKSYSTYVDVLKHYFGDLDTSYRSLDQYKNDQDYLYTTYIKGSIMFYNIYDTMGKAKFNKALSIYFDKCKGSVATPEQLIASFTSAFGSDMTTMFKSYIEGKDIQYPTAR